ncbi:MAG: hypothetical protein ACKO4W_09280, partial [Bacteroidota bacterium]
AENPEQALSPSLDNSAYHLREKSVYHLRETSAKELVASPIGKQAFNSIPLIVIQYVLLPACKLIILRYSKKSPILVYFSDFDTYDISMLDW